MLDKELGKLKNIAWSKRPQHVPVVLTRHEMQRVLQQLTPNPQKWLIASLLYGTGMRLIECLRLRVKDVDFEKFIITIRDAKGEKDRVVPLPKKLLPYLRTQLVRRVLTRTATTDPVCKERAGKKTRFWGKDNLCGQFLP